MGGPVFICYARVDEERVLPLAEQLRQHGVEVWLDQWAIPHGSDWDASIDSALANCAGVVILLSAASVASEEVRAELRTSLDLKKPILPVLIEPCAVPRRLRLRQNVDLSREPLADAASVQRVVSALREAMSGRASSSLGPAPPARRDPPPRARERAARAAEPTIIGRLRQAAIARPTHFLATSLTPLAVAMAHVFRLPAGDRTLILVEFLAAVALALALWIRNRLVAAIIALTLGLALVLKPWIVPYERSPGGWRFAYTSETAMWAWVPGMGLIFLGLVVLVTASRTRLAADLRGLRPSRASAALTIATLLPSLLYFSRPTVYDVYLRFRPPYQALRAHLRAIAPAFDHASPLELAEPLVPPLVLDQSSRVRDEHPSTTGHLILFQHLLEPDAYFGDIEYALPSSLQQRLEDTGDRSFLGFAQFASGSEAPSLQRVLDAPYLVVVRATSVAGRVDAVDYLRAAPYRVFVARLSSDTVLFAGEVASVATKDELVGGVHGLLRRAVNATILE